MRTRSFGKREAGVTEVKDCREPPGGVGGGAMVVKWNLLAILYYIFDG